MFSAITRAGEVIAMQIQLLKENVRITSSEVLVNALREDFKAEKRECFGVVYLSTKNKAIHSEIVSIGTLGASIVHPREVFRPAILHSSNSVIVVHNHPSGDPTPSNCVSKTVSLAHYLRYDDMELTKRLAEAGKILGIELLDHVIVGNGGFVSLKERGVI